uniref:Ribonuclease Z n=1 Tax=Polysiphonia sertularioides TaxID=945028 RepID=A0A1Z1MFZ6_9FLOR|nr:ribonuclease Z [Polysiphonia sertularioides]
MILRYLDIQTYIFRKKNMSFLIKLPSLKDVWLLNCVESSQFNFFHQSFKINNISKIIIPSLHTLSISGLLGLLSTLSLVGRVKSLHVYAPSDLKYYLDLGKKYSRTNFSYVLYLHVLKTGLIINQYGCRMYAIKSINYYEFMILHSEHHGTFNLDKATSNNIIAGPIYGKFKKGSSFLCPDGFTIDGYKLTSINKIGFQLSCLFYCFYKKRFFEMFVYNNLVLLINF